MTLALDHAPKAAPAPVSYEWTLDALLYELNRRNVTLWQTPDGHLRAEPEAAVRGLVPALKTHKEGLLESIPFERSASAKKVRLALLGETIWLAADNWEYTPDDPKRPQLCAGLVVYRCREMDQLFAFSPYLRDLAQTKQQATGAWAESLSFIHTVKKDFGGEFVGDGE